MLSRNRLHTLSLRRLQTRFVAAPILVLLLPLLSACRAFDDHRAALDSLHASGQYLQAASLLDDPEVIDLYGQRNLVLWELERGAVALATDDHGTALAVLDRAERRIELAWERAPADAAAQWLLNDTAAPYLPEPWEDMYLNVLKILTHLERGTIAGGATVEARRLASKSDLLRDRYLRYAQAIDSRRRELPDAALSLDVPTVDDGRFVESPLGTFLSAVAFAQAGETEHAAVARRRLVESIRAQQDLLAPVRAEDIEPLAAADLSSCTLLVVALSGRGPTKAAERFGPVPIYTAPIYVELPRLVLHPSEVADARVVIAPGADTPLPSALEAAPMTLVEDLSRVAEEHHRRMLPAIRARAVLRAAAKAAAWVVLTETARRSADDDAQGWVEFAGILGGLAFMLATERADLRCWSFLPGQARVALVDLPPGEHRVRVEFRTASGSLAYASDWAAVEIRRGRLATVVTQYWR